MIRIPAPQLRWQLIWILSAFLVLLWGVLTGFFYWRGVHDARQEAREHLSYEISRLAIQLQHELDHGEWPDAERLLTLWAAEPNMDNLVLADSSGRILLANRIAWKNQIVHRQIDRFDQAVFQQVLQNRRPAVTWVSQISSLDAYFPIVWHKRQAAQIRGERAAILFGRYDLRPVHSRILASVGISAAMLAVLLGVGVGTIWYLLRRFLLEPLQQFAAATRRFGSGDRQIQLQAQGTGELADLIAGFNQMALRLGRSQRQLLQQRALFDTLAEVNQAIIRAESIQEVIRDLCQTLVNRAGFILVWLGEVKHREARVDPVAAAAARQVIL
ncbi:MAG TPA: HAMP domain-containing protein, partial [Methylothermaceae bacterium]|nr:HAMP domain-containing protein [Methylothermaceae bacterium]